MTAATRRNRLIVTADDFGLAKEVNEAVELAHRFGILSAASLMVGADAAEDAISRARGLPRLAVGLHVVLSDGAPTLPPDTIPDLVDERGFLRCDLARLGLDIFVRANVREQMKREIRAQFEAYLRSGLRLDHVDVHQHFHLHPNVAAEIISVGREFGMHALRVPAEPPWKAEAFRASTILNAIDPTLALLKLQARRAGLYTADAVFGWAWSGHMTSARLIRLLSNLPPGLIEIYCHPATSDKFKGQGAGYRYREEFEALLSKDVGEAFRRSAFSLGSYTSGSADVTWTDHGRSARQ